MSKKPTTEVTVSNPKLQKDLELVQSLQTQVDTVGTQLLQVKVMDDSTLSICQQNLSKVNSIVKTIEEKRVELKAPYLEAGKQIDSLCKSITDLAVKSITHAKSEIANWENARLALAAAAQAEVDAKAKAEADKIAANETRKKGILDFISTTLKPYLQSTYDSLKSAEDCDVFLAKIKKDFPGEAKFQEYLQDANQIRDNYIDLINGKKAQFSAAANISESELALMKEKERLTLMQQELDNEKLRVKQLEEYAKLERERKAAEELAELEKAKLQAAAGLEKTKGVRYIDKFEVIDFDKVPREFLCVDEAKVKAYQKENKIGEITGIRFFKQSSIVA